MKPRNETAPASAPKPRKRVIMTKADWDRVERPVRRAEHEPDPAQTAFLPREAGSTGYREGDA